MKSEVVCDGIRFGEGPVWCGDGTLVVTSVAEGALYRVWPEQNRATRIAETGGGANGAALAADGSILVTQNGGIDFTRDAGCSTTRRRFRPVTPGLQLAQPDGAVTLSRRRRLPRARTISPSPPTAPCTSPIPPHYPPPERTGGPRDGATRATGRCRRSPSELLVLQRHRVRARRHRRRGRRARAAARARRRQPRVGHRDARARRRRRLLRRRRRPLLRRVDDRARHPRRRSATARSSTSSRSRARASPPTAASAAPTCARCSSPTRCPGHVVAFDGMPTPGPPAPDVAGAVVARQRISARTARRDRGPNARGRRAASRCRAGRSTRR